MNLLLPDIAVSPLTVLSVFLALVRHTFMDLSYMSSRFCDFHGGMGIDLPEHCLITRLVGMLLVSRSALVEEDAVEVFHY